jgi:hypothetical protein
MRALYPILARDNLRFNINAFNMYILPRMMSIPLFLENKTRHGDFEKLLRSLFKQWMRIPKMLSS